eukprot:7202054-Alexandrium_andersonii.AAC.1
MHLTHRPPLLLCPARLAEESHCAQRWVFPTLRCTLAEKAFGDEYTMPEIGEKDTWRSFSTRRFKELRPIVTSSGLKLQFTLKIIGAEWRKAGKATPRA